MKACLLALAFLACGAFGADDTDHGAAGHAAVTPPAYRWGQTFSFRFESAGKGSKPPFVRIFPGGKDVTGKDAKSTLDTLKWARGKSVLYPAEDAAPGLIAVMRGISFVADKDGKGYSAVFEGEFNAIKIRVDKKQMETLLTGKPAELTFSSSTEKGFGIKYKVENATRLLVRLEGDKLFVDKANSSCSITSTGFTGSETFRSAEVAMEKEKGKPCLYQGVPGALKGLPIL